MITPASFSLRLAACSAVVLALITPACRATQITISAAALERTLDKQLFSGPDGRYYLRGSADSGCRVSLEQPHLTFAGNRILIRLHTVARVGHAIGKECLGLSLTKDVDVSMLPKAEGESIGFTDVRIERLSGSSELDFLLTPFLSRKIPSTLRINAVDLLRKVFSRSKDATGYSMTLDSFGVRSLEVDGNRVLLDVDGVLHIE